MKIGNMIAISTQMSNTSNASTLSDHLGTQLRSWRNSTSYTSPIIMGKLAGGTILEQLDAIVMTMGFMISDLASGKLMMIVTIKPGAAMGSTLTKLAMASLDSAETMRLANFMAGVMWKNAKMIPMILRVMMMNAQ